MCVWLCICACVMWWNRNPTVLNDLWLKSSMSTLWFTLSPHVTVHTHAQTKSASYWRQTRAYESACTHLRARASWASIRNIVIWCCSAQAVSSLHTIQFPPKTFEEEILRGVGRNDYCFVLHLWCFVLLVQKVKADSKQTNKQTAKVGGEKLASTNLPSEKRDMRPANSHWHYNHTTSENSSFPHSIVLPNCALLSFAPLLH